MANKRFSADLTKLDELDIAKYGAQLPAQNKKGKYYKCFPLKAGILNGFITLPDSDTDSDSENVHIAWTWAEIPTPDFCIVQESGSVPVSESGNVIKP